MALTFAMTWRRRAAALALALALALGLAAAPATAQGWPPAPPTYADLADLAAAAPVIVSAVIDKAEKLKPDEAGSAAAGLQRQLISARVTAALKAPGAVPPALQYIWDGPVDARGKPIAVKGASVLLFLRPGSGRADQLQLVGARAQLAATPALEAQTRALLTAMAKGDVPVVTGIGAAFRVPGAIPGEAESQFFVTTASGKPISLVLLTRPGTAPALVVATGDVIDDAAQPVAPETLLWYRLACFLPAALPAGVAGDAEVAADYATVLKLLGPCTRTKG